MQAGGTAGCSLEANKVQGEIWEFALKVLEPHNVCGLGTTLGKTGL